MDQLRGHLVDGLFPSKNLCSMNVQIRRSPYLINVDTSDRRTVFIESPMRPLPMAIPVKLVLPNAEYSDKSTYWKIEQVCNKPEMIRQLEGIGLDHQRYFFSDDNHQLYTSWFSHTFNVYIGFIAGQSRGELRLGDVSLEPELTILYITDDNRASLLSYSDKIDNYFEEPLQGGFDRKELMNLSHRRSYSMISSSSPIGMLGSMEENSGQTGPLMFKSASDKNQLKVVPSMPYFISKQPYSKQMMVLLLVLAQLSQISLIYLLKWMSDEVDHKALVVKLCKNICVFLDHLHPDGCQAVHPRESLDVIKQLAKISNVKKAEVEQLLENKYPAQPLSWCTESTNLLLEGPLVHVDFKYFYPTMSAAILPEGLRHRTGLNIRHVMRQLITIRQRFQDQQMTIAEKAIKSVAVTITGKFHEQHSFLYDSYYYHNVLMYGRKSMTELQQFIITEILCISRNNQINRNSTPETLLIQTDGGYFKIPVVKNQPTLDQFQREVNEYLQETYPNCDKEYQPKVKVTLIGNMCIMNQNRCVFIDGQGNVDGSRDVPRDDFWTHFLKTGKQLDGSQYETHRAMLVNGKKRKIAATATSAPNTETPVQLNTEKTTNSGSWVVMSPPDILLLKSPHNDGFDLIGEKRPHLVSVRRLPPLFSS